MSATVSLNPRGAVEYQWQMDDGTGHFTNLLSNGGISGAGYAYSTNTIVPGLAAVSYTTPLLGAQTNRYQVLLSIVGSGVVTSQVATVWALPDYNSPQLLSLAQDNTAIGTVPFMLKVAYSEAMDLASTTNPANYKVNGVAGSVTNAVMIGTSGIELYTTGLTYGSNTLFVTAVFDTAGNVITDTNLSFRCYQAVTNGVVRREWFTNMVPAGNAAVTSLLAYATYVNNKPDVVDYPASLNYGGGGGLNYGQYWSGYLTPSVSGPYTFELFSDDEGRFLLSTDDNPANLQTVVRYNDGICCGNQGSALGVFSGPVFLQAGKSYFFQGFLKQATGGDSFHVLWLMPGNGVYTDIPSSALSYKVWPSSVLTITSMPVSQTVQENQPLSLTVGTAISSEPALAYQWLSNGIPITGMTNPTYFVQYATTNLVNVAYACVVAGYAVNTTNLGGNYTNIQTTANAVVTVTPDFTAPTVLGVVGDTTLTNITVTFSKPLDLASATNLANYTISPSLTIKGIVYVAASNKVVLATAPQTMGQVYTVTFNGLVDLAAARNPIAANTMVPFSAWFLQQGYLQADVFTNTTASLDTFTNSAGYKNNTPDYVNYLPEFWFYADFPDLTQMINYNVRVSGYFVAPSNGYYRFYIRSDDASRLYMNTNGMNPAGKIQIAQETGNSHAYDLGTGGSVS
ncbi:MAG: PA14 domain-containing protein, partial [Verrucomicrobia bacterium]|nr:PA14 domain-containing protein [Verrucomicrobiota bacterium]